MSAILDLSPIYDGQFILYTDNAALMAAKDMQTTLTPDGHIISPSRIKEICTEIAKTCPELILTPKAVELYKRYNDLSDCACDTFTGELLPFQKRGFNAMKNEKNVMYQWSCGTGKGTFSVFLSCYRLQNEVDRVLYFTNKALTFDVVDRYKQFSTLEAVTPLTSWTAKRREKFYMETQAPVLVLNYEKMNTADYEYIIKACKNKRIMVINDECQRLKRRQSNIHKQMSKLKTKLHPVYWYMLSATPMTTEPTDLYNLFRILSPDVYKRVKDFERDYTVNFGEKDRWGTNYIGFQDIWKMGLKAAPYIHTVNKKDPEIASQFPKLEEIVIPIELSHEDKSLYSALQDYGASLNDSEWDEAGGIVFGALLKVCRMPECLLLEPSDNPYALEIHRIAMQHANVAQSAHSNKLAVMIDKAKELLDSGEKLIIFAEHTHNCLFPLSKHLKDNKIDNMLYTGDTSESKREEIKRLFKTTADHNCLLASDAGREGLDLPECGWVFNYDTPPSHAYYEQRSERVHRIISERNRVFSVRFKTIDTVEEKIEETMAGRKEMAAELGIGGEFEEVGIAMTKDDLRYMCSKG